MTFRDPAKKITTSGIQLRTYIDALESFRNTKLKVGFMGGYFDLFHPGHMLMISEARRHCDFLVVSVVSDEQAKQKKPGRPIMPRMMRANAVSQMPHVDAVIVSPPIFDETKQKWVSSPDAYEPIKADIAFFGSDYDRDNLPTHRNTYAPEVMFITQDLGCHTSQIIANIRNPGL